MCLFFVTLLLHLTCISHARTGIYMMLYALTHPEEFTNPCTAFCLGFIQYLTYVSAEAANMIQSTTYVTPSELIIRYLSFRVIVESPTVFIAVLNSPVIDSVGILTLTTGRKQVEK